MMASNWLDRTLIQGPHYCLALNQREYAKAAKECGRKNHDIGEWLAEGEDARVTTFPGGMVVTVRKGKLSWQVDRLAHEAVHIFQFHCAAIGESNPSPEFQAYAIQSIFSNLHAELRKRHKRK